MVWLAKWIREHVHDGRVLIITDRTELDEQIEKVFQGVNEEIHRIKSGSDLVNVLNRDEQWLVCSLIHKFGRSQEGDIDSFLKDIQSHLPKGFRAKGEIFVFIDECHRTQSGKLRQAMEKILPESVMIGFTGTPLLKDDKRKSIEIFGPYIHTFKYNEAVEDAVVLDLRYEARDIDQQIVAQDKIDRWFEVKTRGLSDIARTRLKQRWGTIQKMFEPAMRHLLDNYVRAEESKKLSAFDDMTLVELIVERGEDAIDSLPEATGKNREAVAETIENNVRKVIIDEMAVNPKYYAKMSELLDNLINARREQAYEYERYLREIVELTKRVKNPGSTSYPFSIDTPARRSLYDNLVGRVSIDQVPAQERKACADDTDVVQKVAVATDNAIRGVKKDNWRGMRPKRLEVRNAIKSVLGRDKQLVDEIFNIVENQNDY